MKIFDSVLKPYGIHCKNSVYNLFLSGITLTMFTLLIYHFWFSIDCQESIHLTQTKVFSLISVTLLLLSFLYLKTIFPRLYQVHLNIERYEQGYSMKTNRFYSNCLYFSVQVITYIILLSTVYGFDFLLDNTFKLPESNVQYHYHAALSNFYFNGWMYSTQYIYFELLSKHYNLLEFYDNFLKSVIKDRKFNSGLSRFKIDSLVIVFHINESTMMEPLSNLNKLIVLAVIFLDFGTLSYLFAVENIYLRFLCTIYLSIINYYILSIHLILYLKKKVKTSLMETLVDLRSMDTYEEAMTALMPFRSTNTWILDKIHVKMEFRNDNRKF